MFKHLAHSLYNFSLGHWFAPIAFGIAFFASTAPANTPKFAMNGHNNTNIWQEITSNLQTAPYTKNKQAIQKEIDWYVNHPQSLLEITQNAKPYIYYITHEVKKRHMPLEVALLPMVESNYNPDTTSSAAASGLWQLMPSTARDLGVSINHWYDGRYDVISSTHAALNYLQHLHGRYHSWALAFAAYNSGSATVNRAIRCNKRHHRAIDYDALPLPKETKRYLPKLLAIATILGHPKRYPIPVKAVNNTPYFAEVNIDKTIAIKKIAELANTKISVINRLNPGFRHDRVISVSKVLVPTRNKAAFEVNLANYIDRHEDTSSVYTVQSGDSLSKIASNYHVSTRLLKRSNYLRSNLIKIGQLLYIPI